MADRPKQPSQAQHMRDTAQWQFFILYLCFGMMLSKVNTHPREHHIQSCSAKF